MPHASYQHSWTYPRLSTRINLCRYGLRCNRKIVSHMPSVFKVGEWKLLFSNNRHGSSLQTLLRQVCDRSPLILIIKDVDSYVYGAYLSESLRMNKGQFYGSGETFLYTFEVIHVMHMQEQKCYQDLQMESNESRFHTVRS